MEYFAHSANECGEKHTMSEHLIGTAALAASFAHNEKIGHMFRLAGLLHDLGKYQIGFQNYLENGGRRGSVPHSAWGAGYARLKGMNEISFAIDGHHKGLPDKAHWKNDTEPFKRNDEPLFDGVVKAFCKEIPLDDAGIERGKLTCPTSLYRETLIRYLFSALVDADWLSTERHFAQEKSVLRSAENFDADEMLRRLDEKKFSTFTEDSELNCLRNRVRHEALIKANQENGFYSLALPTGMGKTLTSFAWALQHAKANGLRRIIIVLPYINIIDQTAKVLKEVLGEESVLEHHSNYLEEDDEDVNIEGDYSSSEDQRKLACENWDYPVIITTTVQFFESLFSNRPSKCRKVHNISDSVVIFDEIQTLPKEILQPTLTMLKNVQELMHTSFLFCTATQPAFAKRTGFDGIENIVSLIDNPGEVYDATRRVEYELVNGLEKIDQNELYASVRCSTGSTLVIFNTKKSALQFYERVKKEEQWDCKYHLSTMMCPSHRKKQVENIRQDLLDKTGKKIIVVSTQLIEAGVDFDFPSVFRALAPLESVIQAAGRCNREGRLENRLGKVFLFDLEGGGMPDKTYEACANYAGTLIKADLSALYRHDIFEQYHKDVVSLFSIPDQFRIDHAREEFKFETVSGSYRMIRNQAEGVYAYNFDATSRDLFHSISKKPVLSRDDYRKMQQYTVQAYRNFIMNNSDVCKLMPQGFYVWYGNYDNETGLSCGLGDPDKIIV